MGRRTTTACGRLILKMSPGSVQFFCFLAMDAALASRSLSSSPTVRARPHGQGYEGLIVSRRQLVTLLLLLCIAYKLMMPFLSPSCPDRFVTLTSEGKFRSPAPAAKETTCPSISPTSPQPPLFSHSTTFPRPPSTSPLLCSLTSSPSLALPWLSYSSNHHHTPNAKDQRQAESN